MLENKYGEGIGRQLLNLIVIICYVLLTWTWLIVKSIPAMLWYFAIGLLTGIMLGGTVRTIRES